MNKFLDFLTGGFFNYIGALVRVPFEKSSYKELVEENLSNSYGMFVTSLILVAVFVYIRFA